MEQWQPLNTVHSTIVGKKMLIWHSVILTHSATIITQAFCVEDANLAIGSSQCLSFCNKYLLLLIPITLAGHIIVCLIKLLDLTISQGTMNGQIFYANIIQANKFIFLPWRQTHPLSLFITWLNFVEICFFQGLNAYYI